MRYIRTVRCRCRRLNPNKKKGQSPFTKKTIMVEASRAEVGAKIKFNGYEWDIMEVEDE